MRVGPQPIALVRICLGIVALVNSFEAYFLLSEIAGGKLRLPVHEMISAPTAPAMSAYLAVSVASAIAVAIGWRTTAAAVLLTALNVVVLLWDQQTYSSHRLLMTLLVLYLIFARADGTWCLSRDHATAPWWPQLLMMAQLSVCYFFAAISKINVLFLSGAPLSLWVWLPLPWWMFTLMAIGTVVIELYIAFGLWRPTMRRRAALLGVLLHVGIVTFMRDETVPLIAFTLTCLPIYWLFLSRPTMGVEGEEAAVGRPCTDTLQFDGGRWSMEGPNPVTKGTQSGQRIRCALPRPGLFLDKPSGSRSPAWKDSR